MQIPRNEFACKFQGTLYMGPKSNNQIWGESSLSSASRSHFLQIFRPLRMFKIVLRDSSLYPKQLPLFRLLRLVRLHYQFL